MKSVKMFNLHVDLRMICKRMVVFSLVLCLLSCSKDTVRVTGQVLRIRGNQMPSPDLPAPVYPGISTGIYFFEPVTESSVVSAAQQGIYSTVNARLVKETRSYKNGRFSLRIKPGKYSVFIGKDSLFYANIRDGKGFLNPVDISSGRQAGITLRADWDAYY